MSDIEVVTNDQLLTVPRAYTNITVIYNERGDKGATGAEGPVGALSGYELDSALASKVATVDGYLDTLEGRMGPWIDLTITGDWEIFAFGWQTPRYRKIDNRVYLEGMIHRDVGLTGTAFATLPSGYRPTTPKVLATYANESSVYAFARLDVATSGVLSYSSGGTNFVSLNGINFATD